jgi:hypothetical protein
MRFFRTRSVKRGRNVRRFQSVSIHIAQNAVFLYTLLKSRLRKWEGCLRLFDIGILRWLSRARGARSEPPVGYFSVANNLDLNSSVSKQIAQNAIFLYTHRQKKPERQKIPKRVHTDCTECGFSVHAPSKEAGTSEDSRACPYILHRMRFSCTRSRKDIALNMDRDECMGTKNVRAQ